MITVRSHRGVPLTSHNCIVLYLLLRHVNRACDVDKTFQQLLSLCIAVSYVLSVHYD